MAQHVFQKDDSPFDGRLRLLNKEDVEVLQQDDSCSLPYLNGDFSEVFKSISFSEYTCIRSTYIHSVIIVLMSIDSTVYTISIQK